MNSGGPAWPVEVAELRKNARGNHSERKTARLLVERANEKARAERKMYSFRRRRRPEA